MPADELTPCDVACGGVGGTPDRGGERVPGAAVLGERGLGDLGEALEMLGRECVDERLLRGEVAVDGADADARPPRDVLDLRLQPALGERGRRRGDDLLAVATGVCAQRPVSGG